MITRLGIRHHPNPPQIKSEQASLSRLKNGTVFEMNEKIFVILNCKPVATGKGGGEYIFTIVELNQEKDGDYIADSSRIFEIKDIIVTPLKGEFKSSQKLTSQITDDTNEKLSITLMFDQNPAENQEAA